MMTKCQHSKWPAQWNQRLGAAAARIHAGGNGLVLGIAEVEVRHMTSAQRRRVKKYAAEHGIAFDEACKRLGVRDMGKDAILLRIDRFDTKPDLLG